MKDPIKFHNQTLYERSNQTLYERSNQTLYERSNQPLYERSTHQPFIELLIKDPLNKPLIKPFAKDPFNPFTTSFLANYRQPIPEDGHTWHH